MRSLREGSFPAKVALHVRRAVIPDKADLPEMRFCGGGRNSEQDLIWDDICLPPYYGPADHDDVTPLFDLVRTVNPSIVIEFGTAQGNITANICRLTGARVITVNAPPEVMSGQATTFTLGREYIGRVYRKYGFAERVCQIYANTLDVDLAEYAAPLSADLGIIDACHDYEYVLSDFLKIVPYIRQGGIVLLHDTHPDLGPPRDGSYKACRQLRREGFDIRHIRGTWWGIWGCGGLHQSLVEEKLTSLRPAWIGRL